MIRYLSKCLVCLGLFLVLGIFCKYSSEYKELIKYKIYEDNVSFSVFEEVYNKYLGGVFPMEGYFGLKSEAVFNEELVMKDSIPYYDGLMINVGYNYLIPNMDEGVVVYIGEKEKYGNVVMIENSDGINIWYGNVCNSNVALYDHINKGDIIGESCDNYLYLLYNKDNEFLDYDEIGTR